MLNQINLMGRVTKSPELRQTPSGVTVATFTLAVDRDFTSGDSEKKTDFINIVAWRQTAEFVKKYFVKGQLVAVAGRLQTREWSAQDGSKRYATEVVANNVYFAERKRKEPEFEELDEDDGDLPF